MKIRKIKSVLTLLLVSSLIIGSTLSLQMSKAYSAYPFPAIYMKHSTFNPTVGQFIQTQIKVCNIHGFAGYQVRIKYDKSSLEPYVNETTPMRNSSRPSTGDILLQDFTPFSFANNDISNGILNFARYYVDVRAFKSSGISESNGTVAVVYFKVLKNSVNPLNSISFESPSTTTPVEYIEDVNKDKSVNMTDAVLVSKSFNTLSTDPNYIKEYDLNKDSVINMIDIVMIFRYFNTVSNSIKGTCLYNWNAQQINYYYAI